tara:strand:- start:152319 stop:155141 length:2823 start_codon:yes stop_codon:yes gene_type:complete
VAVEVIEHRRNKVLRRVLLLFVLAAVLPIVVGAAISYFQVKTSLEEQAYARLHSASKLRGGLLLNRLLETEALLAHLSVALTSEVEATARLLSDLTNHTDAILFMNALGKVSQIAGDVTASALADTLFPESNSAQNRTSIIRPVQSSDVFMTVAVPEPAANQAANRVVALLSRKHLFGTQDSDLLGSHFCVFDALKLLFCSSGLQDRMHDVQSLRNRQFDQNRLRMRSEGELFFVVSRDLFLPSRFESNTWSIISIEDESSVFEPISTFRWVFPLTVVLAVMSILLLLISQTRRQLSPLSALRRAAVKLGEGDFDNRILIETGDEFEELGDSFNIMADKLGAQFRFLIAMTEIDAILLSSPDLLKVTESVVKRLPSFIPVQVAAVLVVELENALQALMLVNDAEAQAGQVSMDRIVFSESLRDSMSLGVQFTAQADDSGLEFLAGRLSDNTTVYLFPLLYEQRLFGCLCLGERKDTPLSEELLEQAHSVADRLNVAFSVVERQRHLYEQAHFDSMTGLPNRELFLDRLSQHLVLAKRNRNHVAIIYCDLNQFKQVNDTLGHAQGDELLKQAALRFQSVVRESDTLARLSGDEFVFALPNLVEAKDVLPVVKGILDELAEPFTLMNQQFILSCGVGISIYPQDGDSAEELLKNADVAMYRTKNEPGAHYRFFEKNMNETLVERIQLGQQLRLALADRQLLVVYQPKVHVGTHRIHSVEALLRWKHPELGWISPAKFIPIAEEIGLIESLGEFVLETACAAFARWRSAGLAIEQIGVNVSARQILYTDIVGAVGQVLETSGIAPGCLELELTESLLIEDYATTEQVLSALRNMNVGLALDDFGTGYSSLSHLHQLPFDTLKIDKSFVDDVGVKPKVDAIIIAIIALAKGLGKSIVAEGIEHLEQEEFLAQQGCELLQGYRFSKPVPEEELTVLLVAGAIPVR